MTTAAFPIGLGVAILATPLAKHLAVRFDILDHPGPLKIHREATPYLGGTAVMAGLVAGSLGVRVGLFLPLVLALVLGLLDDAGELSPRVRLTAEVGIGLVTAAVLGAALPSGVLVVGLVVVLINAVNLLDGMDGLASGVALVSVAGFVVVLSGQRQTLALALAGALGGFLVFNRPPASIYLGDSGAYLLGTALAVLVVSAWSDAGPEHFLFASLAMVAVPIADTTVAVVRRLRAGEALFAGDRGHIYDQLVDRGLTKARATLLCIGAQLLLTVGAIATLQSGSGIALTGLLVTFGAFGVGLLKGGFVSPEYARS